MLGLDPIQQGYLIHSAYALVLLGACATYVWLYRHRYTIKGVRSWLRRHL